MSIAPGTRLGGVGQAYSLSGFRLRWRSGKATGYKPVLPKSRALYSAVSW